MLAWKFHFILSTTMLASRPALSELSSGAHDIFLRTKISLTTQEKFYLVLPLTTATQFVLSSTKDDGRVYDDEIPEPRSTIVIDWTLIRQVVQLAEEQIAVEPSIYSKVADTEATERQPPNILDLAQPSPFQKRLPLASYQNANWTPAYYPLTRVGAGHVFDIAEPVLLYPRHIPTNFFVFFRLRPDLTPASPLLGTRNRSITYDLPEYANLSSSTASETEPRTFVTHYREKYGVEVRTDQLLYEVFYLPHVKNLFRPGISQPEINSSTVRQTTLFMIPELCRVHPICGPLLVDALNLPSILWKAENLFLVEEFVRLSGMVISTYYYLFPLNDDSLNIPSTQKVRINGSGL